MDVVLLLIGVLIGLAAGIVAGLKIQWGRLVDPGIRGRAAVIYYFRRHATVILRVDPDVPDRLSEHPVAVTVLRAIANGDRT